MKLFSDEKVVIITGASSGIGQDTAVKFVEKGITKLCLNGRNGEGLDKTKQDCVAANKEAEVLLVQGCLALRFIDTLQSLNVKILKLNFLIFKNF